jgi:hypothetical protein
MSRASFEPGGNGTTVSAISKARSRERFCVRREKRGLSGKSEMSRNSFAEEKLVSQDKLALPHIGGGRHKQPPALEETILEPQCP